MSIIKNYNIIVDEEAIEISIETKPYFRNDTLQPIYIYKIDGNLIDNNNNTNNIITYYIRGISNKIYTVIDNYHIFNILNEKYQSLLPNFNFLTY